MLLFGVCATCCACSQTPPPLSLSPRARVGDESARQQGAAAAAAMGFDEADIGSASPHALRVVAGQVLGFTHGAEGGKRTVCGAPGAAVRLGSEAWNV